MGQRVGICKFLGIFLGVKEVKEIKGVIAPYRSLEVKAKCFVGYGVLGLYGPLVPLGLFITYWAYYYH